MAKQTEVTGVVSIDTRKQPEVPKQALAIAQGASLHKIVDDESYASAAAMIQTSELAIRNVEQYFEEDKNLAHKLHASICEKIRTLTAPLRSVRSTLEPRMKTFLAAKEREKREAEARQQREDAEKQRLADLEAKRIQDEADAKAAELRKQGLMKQAEAAKQAAADQVAQVQAEAEEIGTILPDNKPQVAGVGSARKWRARVKEGADRNAVIMEIMQQIVAGQRGLLYPTPVRGKGVQELPLLTLDDAVLDEIGARLQREDIGIPGCEGYTDFGLRFSKSTPAINVRGQQDEGDSWL